MSQWSRSSWILPDVIPCFCWIDMMGKRIGLWRNLVTLCVGAETWLKASIGWRKMFEVMLKLSVCPVFVLHWIILHWVMGYWSGSQGLWVFVELGTNMTLCVGKMLGCDLCVCVYCCSVCMVSIILFVHVFYTPCSPLSDVSTHQGWINSYYYVSIFI